MTAENIKNEGVRCMKNAYINSLAHMTWECKYHIVFAPKFRRKEVEIINAEACPDHVHMYVSIAPKMSVPSFMGYLKGKSTLIIFERHANLKSLIKNSNN